MTPKQRQVLEAMKGGAELRYDMPGNSYFLAGESVPTGRIWKLHQDGLLEVNAAGAHVLTLEASALLGGAVA